MENEMNLLNPIEFAELNDSETEQISGGDGVVVAVEAALAEVAVKAALAEVAVEAALDLVALAEVAVKAALDIKSHPQFKSS